jgi:NADH:ubiquinone oxidoreductase subunit 2 (subunit N)
MMVKNVLKFFVKYVRIFHNFIPNNEGPILNIIVHIALMPFLSGNITALILFTNVAISKNARIISEIKQN